MDTLFDLSPAPAPDLAQDIWFKLSKQTSLYLTPSLNISVTSMCNLTSKTDNFHYWPSFKRHEVYNNIFLPFLLGNCVGKKVENLGAQHGAEQSPACLWRGLVTQTLLLASTNGQGWSGMIQIFTSHSESTQNNEKTGYLCNTV